MRPTLAILAICATLLSGRAAASPAIVLHAEEGYVLNCHGDPCGGDSLRTTMEIGRVYSILVYVTNCDSLAGVYTAFDWPADWQFIVGLAQCLPGQICGQAPYGPGPMQGILSTTFNCVTGGSSTNVAILWLRPTSAGCIRQIQPVNFPLSLLKCDLRQIELGEDALGSVCAGMPGVDVCRGPVQVAPSTWGAIKATY